MLKSLRLVIAVLAVTSVATSAVLIRLASGVSAFEIAFWRLVVATAALTPPMLARGGAEALRGVGLGRFAVYSGILAAHFVAYNLALRYAPIAHVLPLAYTSIVIVAVLSWLVLREWLTHRQVAGIAVVLLGIAVLAGFDPSISGRVLIGDAFAVLTALTFALYSIAGRRERERVPLLPYAVLVYGFAALWTAPLALVTSDGGYSLQVILALIGLGLIPNAIGHTLFNASLRYLDATIANVLFTQEITLGILLGWLVLGEVPSATALIGAVVMLVGIVAVVRT